VHVAKNMKFFKLHSGIFGQAWYVSVHVFGRVRSDRTVCSLLGDNLLKTAFTYVNSYWKRPLQIDFVYLVNKEIYRIFEACCIIFLFSTKLCYFINLLSFFVQIICFHKPCAKI
jgi:hypothetical protein